jgi:hypothetical protein
VLSLTPAARKAFWGFRHKLEPQMLPGAKLSALSGWTSKLPGFTARLAGLMHVWEHGAAREPIPEETIERAIALAELLIEHALAASNLIGADEAASVSKHVLEWIQAQGCGRFKVGDLTAAMRHRKFGRAKILKGALEELMERRIISPALRYPGSKSIEHRIHRGCQIFCVTGFSSPFSPGRG